MSGFGNYEGIVIRPPSEADSLIFQVTLGCSDNRCVFCPAYKAKKFSVRDIAEIEEEMRQAAALFPGARKIFLADGDALAAPQDTLERVLEAAGRSFPRLTRAAVYGSVKSLEGKTVADLRRLKELKLGIVYLGFETGDGEVYRRIRKYGSPEGNVAACLKVKEAGLKTNVTVILGLGGKELSESHAARTAEILNGARPHQVAALTLMIVPGTPLHAALAKKEFVPLEQHEYVRELAALVGQLEDFPCLFFSNHASNYYPVQARFPHDKESVIAELAAVCAGRKPLRPEHLRDL